jgi:G:T-mismatch repair DNA endonuclease (very short patch repair protein)
MNSTVTIDYRNTTQRTRLVKGKPRVDTYYLAQCACGCDWYVRADRVEHIQSCYLCSQSERGKKGYAATKAKYGEFYALRHWREWRIENPTCLERRVARWLDELGVFYEREYWFDSGNGIFLLDFLVNSSLAIEVNGAYWHETPSAIERDERKADALRYHGFEVLALTEEAVTSGDAYALIQAALKQLVS